MVCIYCGFKTQVTNSRHQRRSNQTWRRRECVSCQSLFTTEESALYGLAWLVEQADGKYRAFERDLLFLSLYEALKHRKAPVKDAKELTDTVIYKLVPSGTNGRISRSDIRQLCLVVLSRFDAAAATSYEAFHRD